MFLYCQIAGSLCGIKSAHLRGHSRAFIAPAEMSPVVICPLLTETQRVARQRGNSTEGKVGGQLSALFTDLKGVQCKLCMYCGVLQLIEFPLSPKRGVIVLNYCLWHAKSGIKESSFCMGGKNESQQACGEYISMKVCRGSSLCK